MKGARGLGCIVALAGAGLVACGGAGPVERRPDAGNQHDAGWLAEAGPGPDAGTDAGVDGGELPAEPRVVLVSRDGEVAVTDVTSPWAARGTAALGDTIASLRCAGGRCVVVHPAPADALSWIDASDAHLVRRIPLERGSDPRDVALVDDTHALVTFFASASLALVDLETGDTTRTIDLATLADDDGLPEASRAAICGERVFVQLLRIVHATGEASPLGPALGVVDLGAASPIVDVDATTPGDQAIALSVAPAFDMPVDCAAGLLRVAEPRPILSGGSRFEEIDLNELTAHDLDLPDTAEVGGFVYLDDTHVWAITHTEFGPGPSSHLNLVGSTTMPTYNTFADEHVDDLAADAESGLVFFPNPCSRDAWAACDPGLVVFDGATGELAAEQAVTLSIRPIEIAVSRP